MNDYPGSEDERIRRLLNDAVSDVEPRESLDSIRSRTVVTPFRARRPWNTELKNPPRQPDQGVGRQDRGCHIERRDIWQKPLAFSAPSPRSAQWPAQC